MTLYSKSYRRTGRGRGGGGGGEAGREEIFLICRGGGSFFIRKRNFVILYFVLDVNVCACIYIYTEEGSIIANETNTTPDRDRCLEMAS